MSKPRPKAKPATVLGALTLSELSLVDAGANPFAAVTLTKRADPAGRPGAAEAINFADAVNFADALHRQTVGRDLDTALSRLWEFQDALRASVMSIIEDDAVADKDAAVRASLTQFASAVLGLLPGAADAVLPDLIGKAAAGAAAPYPPESIDMNMEQMAASLEAAEAKLTALTAQVGEVTKRAETAETRVGDLTAQVAELTKRAEAAEKRAEDAAGTGRDGEGEDEVMKSLSPAARALIEKARKDAADAQAEVAKRDADLAAERAARELVELEKRAEAELPHLPGAPRDKALVLKAMAGMDATARGALDAMLKAGDAAMKGQLTEIGKGGGGDGGGAEPGSAEAQLNAKAAEIRKAHPELSQAQAFTRAVTRNPQLYADYTTEVAKRRGAAA